MSKKNIPLDFKNPKFKQSLKVNPLKILSHQNPTQKHQQHIEHESKSTQVQRHKNITKPQTTKQTKELPYKTKMCPLGRDCKKQFTCRYAHHQKQLRRPFYKRTKPCLLYQRGMCGLGSACRQYHGNFDLKNWNQNTYKKTLCQDYMNGNCQKGQMCIKAHGLQQLQQYQKDEQIEASKVNEQPQKQKPLVIQVSSYKPHTFTMEIVETVQKVQDQIKVGQSFDLFLSNQS